jgi:[acyl-carrier-protein] S-malonyltransferase
MNNLLFERNLMLGLFPGQGSQSIGMLDYFLSLSDKVTKDYIDIANEALGFSLYEIIQNGSNEQLKETQYAQPAILLVSTLAFNLQSITPNVAIGHSLGEYSALVASGALNFNDAIKLVHNRGLYMQEAVPIGVGKMAAVLGKSVVEVEEVISSVSSGIVEIANLNSIGQIVVSGEVAAIEEFKEILIGAKVKDLAVSAPFHSSLMKPAAERFAKDIANTTFNKLSFPVISNVTAQPHDNDNIKNLLVEQIFSRVRFTECLQYAIEHFGVTKVYEFAPGNVLTGLVKRSGFTLEVYNE